jgi:hypothetical protein
VPLKLNRHLFHQRRAAGCRNENWSYRHDNSLLAS